MSSRESSPRYLLLLLVSIAAATPNRSGGGGECELESGGTPWISSIVSRSLSDYIPAGEHPLDHCTKDGLLYAEHLANLTLWATKMYDASSRGIVPGLLEGRNYEFGHFEECVKAASSYHRIRGKYVVVDLVFQPKTELYPTFESSRASFREPRDEASAWEAIKPTRDPRISPRNRLNWALCVPSSCSDRDVQNSLQRKLYPALESHRILANLSVLSKYSYTRVINTRTPISTYIFICTTVFLLALALASTIYDVNLPPAEGDNKPWFVNFSLKRNWDDLLKASKNELAVISGMKVISMLIIIYGHRMMISVSNPMFNPNNIQLASGTYWATIIDNGTLVVNTFMTITGFLTFYKISKDLYDNKDLKVCKNICNRFLRLTPAYLFVMAFQYFVFPNVEGGPMSRSAVWDPQAFGTYWWSHLTYVNNYFKPEYQCLIPSWYIALDMHMYIFAYLLGAVMQRFRSFTPYMLTLVTIISLAVPARALAAAKYWGTYRIFYTSIMDYFRDPEFQDMYMPTHVRAAPYVIGMFGGFVYYHLKTKKCSFQSRTLWTWSLLSFCVLHVSIGGAFLFYVPGREYNLWENVAYTVLHRLGWSISIVWIIIASSIGNFGLFKFFLGHSFYELFNKLNYTVLLVHTLVQIYMIGYIRAPVNYGRITGLWMACGDIAFSYTAAVFLHLLVEAPFSHLQHKLWQISFLTSKSIKK